MNKPACTHSVSTSVHARSRRGVARFLRLFSLLLIAVASFTNTTHAALVGVNGYTNSFGNPPPAADWSTASGPGSSITVSNASGINTLVQALTASGITMATVADGNTLPNINGLAEWSAPGHFLQTRPTTNAATYLMCRLINNLGADAVGASISYNYAEAALATEEVSGQRAYYSLTGTTGSWVNIPAFSSAPTGQLSAILNFAWLDGSPLYLLWADDNGIASPDTACQIDNFSVTAIPTPAVVINEWMAVNTGSVLDPADGHPDAWFELYNTTSQAVNVSDWHLTDDPSQPTKFTIPGGVAIPAYGYMLFWADDESLQGGDHVNFTLTNSNGYIGLFDAAVLLIDSVTYGAQVADISQGRVPDGSATIGSFTDATPGHANLTGPGLTAQPVSVITNCYSTVTFSAAAAGALPLSFQWHFNCRNIPGANAATLILSNVTLRDVGQYSVTIGNAFGTVSSDDAFLSLDMGTPPVLSAVQDTNVVVSWPQTCANYTLEETLSLRSPIMWSPVEQGARFIGGIYSVSFPFGGNTKFFRLASSSLRIIAPPTGRATFLPGVVNLDVTAEGEPPLSYQWRLNGFILPDQTNSQMDAIISSPNDYGAYQVTVQDANQALNVGPAVIRPGGEETVLADLFSNQAIFTNTDGSIHGSTISASREAGEPVHAGVPGGKSVWLSWRAPTAGVAIFDTAGSAFDTLLAVYTGSNVSGLTLVASDDDSAGYLRSRVSFVTMSNRVYHIAIDGTAGSAGSFLLNWSFSTDGLNNPVIDVQPLDRVVVTNQSITLSVTAHGVNGLTNLSYQWFRNGSAIAGASGPFLDINNITPAEADSYFVAIDNSAGRAISRPATLQISSNPQHFFASKVLADFICPPVLNSAYEPLPLVGVRGGKPGHGVIGPAAAGSISGSLGSFSAKAGCPLGICTSRGYYAWITNITTSCGVSNLMTFDLVGTTGNSTLAIYTNLYKSPIKCAVSTNSGIDQPSISFIAKTGFTYQVVVSLPSSNTVVNLNFSTGLCQP